MTFCTIVVVPSCRVEETKATALDPDALMLAKSCEISGFSSVSSVIMGVFTWIA
ncbi:MAG: hypothetical protein BWZ10_02372 [candidate division BRC1 bacterium ADurb.BinA364]|nr:MAG: hypothetical protein BWZ10_02372 [candidate division BRC1 bacterium ADurb.BinA364]